VLLFFGCADKETPITPEYQVTLDTDGGTTIPSQTIVEGDTVLD
jgi:hypothetical protein